MKNKFKINDIVIYGDIKNAIVGAIIDGGKKYRILYYSNTGDKKSYTVDVTPDEIVKLE